MTAGIPTLPNRLVAALRGLAARDASPSGENPMLSLESVLSALYVAWPSIREEITAAEPAPAGPAEQWPASELRRALAPLQEWAEIEAAIEAGSAEVACTPRSAAGPVATRLRPHFDRLLAAVPACDARRVETP